MDDDKITKALATARLRVAKREDADPEEVKALQHVIKLYDAEAAAKKAVKEADRQARRATLEQYGEAHRPTTSRRSSSMTSGAATIAPRHRRRGRLRSTQASSRGCAYLAERYEATVGELDAEVEQLERQGRCAPGCDGGQAMSDASRTSWRASLTPG